MKRFLQVLPFLLVFVVIFGVQTYMEANNMTRPFLDPFGRAAAIGTTTPNRPPQAIGDNQFAYLYKTDIVYQTVDPTGKHEETKRPVPNRDIFSRTLFQLAGDRIFWIGNEGTLKTATWQQSKWSAEQVIGHEAESLTVAQQDGKTYLLAGTDKKLRILDVTNGALKEAGSFPLAKAVNVNATPDAAGKLHIGAINQSSAQTYELYYLTLDPKTQQVAAPVMVKDFTLATGIMIYDNSFGIDKTHGYFLMTYKSTRADNRELTIATFPLNQPASSQVMKLKDPAIDFGFSYGAYAEPGQHDALTFAFVAQLEKNPRVHGFEVFATEMQDGKWKQEETHQLSNTHAVALNPVMTKKGGDTILLFTKQTSYEDYEVYFNSDNKQYAAATNVVTSDDYTNAAMSVPQYLGIAMISFFMAMAWPVLSYCYLIFFVIKHEDQLYDRANLHLLVSIAIYIASQLLIFFNYAKFDLIETYAPEWMHSRFAIGVFILLLDVVCYLFTRMFGKLRYERNAMAEFSYFMALNIFTVLLALSYFMAS